ncbi:MAG: ASKHA domain-containing protein [Thermogutta sp.]
MPVRNPVPLRVLPLERELSVAPGSRFLDAALDAGIHLDLPCGGEGVCGKCRVIVAEGAPPPNDVERDNLSAEELSRGGRLACQLIICGPTVVEIPGDSLLKSTHQILTAVVDSSRFEGRSPVRKFFGSVRPPCASGRTGEEGGASAELSCAEKLAGAEIQRLADAGRLLGEIRAVGDEATAVVVEDRLVAIEPGDTRGATFGAAFDLGTTTLVASLVDLNGGDEFAVAARINPQIQFGEDVVSRIQAAVEREDGLRRLQGVLRDSLNEMLREFAEKKNIPRDRIYAAAVSGNTTMQHLFCGLDPAALGRYPFMPVVRHGLSVDAAEVGLEIHPAGRVYVMPVIGGFVGGDTAGGILSSGMLAGESPAVLVDIGTNGEIVLFAGGRLRAAATAAGPAFEGARILHGMRAAQGAIERVIWNPVTRDIEFQVIGGGIPSGLCGSALIDLLAVLLDTGVLRSDGRLSGDSGPRDDVSAAFLQRITSVDGQPAFVVSWDSQRGRGVPIVLTQRDIRQLQLASGAIRAGITILLKQAGIRGDELRAVYVAGGFGNYIRRRNAQRIGLFPADIPRDRILYRGNTSLLGARMTLLSLDAREEVESIAARTEHVDLSLDPDFRWAFAEAMIFPQAQPAAR